MFPWQNGRTKDYPPLHAIEFDQRERRSKLLMRCDEHRVAAQLLSSTSEGSSDKARG